MLTVVALIILISGCALSLRQNSALAISEGGGDVPCRFWGAQGGMTMLLNAAEVHFKNNQIVEIRVFKNTLADPSPAMTIACQNSGAPSFVDLDCSGATLHHPDLGDLVASFQTRWLTSAQVGTFVLKDQHNITVNSVIVSCGYAN